MAPPHQKNYMAPRLKTKKYLDSLSMILLKGVEDLNPVVKEENPLEKELEQCRLELQNIKVEHKEEIENLIIKHKEAISVIHSQTCTFSSYLLHIVADSNSVEMLSQLSGKWKKKFEDLKEIYKQTYLLPFPKKFSYFDTKKIFQGIIKDWEKKQSKIIQLEAKLKELSKEIKYSYKSHKKPLEAIRKISGLDLSSNAPETPLE